MCIVQYEIRAQAHGRKHLRDQSTRITLILINFLIRLRNNFCLFPAEKDLEACEKPYNFTLKNIYYRA